jgi:2-desacetyl-2-hydroxyethyl bacteriochlorophyllide A dehydrogenase
VTQIQVTGPRKIELLEMDGMTPKAGEVLLETLCTGVSVGTEMAVYRGEIPNLNNGRWGYWNEFPIVLGYEFAGQVTAIGDGVEGFSVGQRVACLAPHGEQACVASGELVPIPDGVNNEDAIFSILGATTTHGVRRAGIRYGDTVVVLGLGVIGFLTAFHAGVSGAGRVVVADPLAWKRNRATELGFVDVLDPTAPGFAPRILEVTDGLGADVVIEASGNTAAWKPAFEAVSYGGKILVMGTQTHAADIVFSDYVMHKEITIIGTWAIGNDLPIDGRLNRWNGRANIEGAMRKIATGGLPVSGLISHRIPFSDLPSLYGRLESGELEYLQILVTYN